LYPLEGRRSTIRLMLGDCLEKMKDIPDGSVDRRNLTDGERAELPDYITSPEAQKLLGVNRQRISALLKTGQLRGKKDGRRWRIERASVEERLKALRK